MKKFRVAPLTLSLPSKQCHDPKNSNNHHCLIATKDILNYKEIFHLSTIRHWKISQDNTKIFGMPKELTQNFDVQNS